jgi:hypothetical protein
MFSVYIYDKTFDGLLTAVFDAYFRKTFPDALLSEGDALPLFCDELHTVVTDEEKAGRVAGITEESFLFRFGLPHTKLAVGASGSRDAYFSLYP